MRSPRLALAVALSAAGMLAAVSPAWPQTSAASSAATAAMRLAPRRVVLLEPDTARAPSFPDSTWNEVAEVAPGRRAGVRLEVSAPDSIAALRWLDSVQVRLLQSGRGVVRRDALLPVTFFRHPMCASSKCDSSGGVFAVFGYVGLVPFADTTRLVIAWPGPGHGSAVGARPDSAVGAARDPVAPEPRDSSVVFVWAHAPGRFALGASYGVTLPLNSVSGRSVVPRLGMNGRLLAFELRPSGPVMFHGPVLMEGEFLLGVAALQHDSAGADSSQTFRQSSEGSIRIELPFVDFGGDVSLRVFLLGGFMTVPSQPNYYVQHYYGLRLGMDAADISGRQSYVEFGTGGSDNLRPSGGRWRITVQLVIPRTPIVFQFGVNYARSNHRDPSTSDSPVILSAFTTQDFQFLYNLISG